MAARDPLYLEDLAPGRRFATAEHTVDEAEMLAFAGRYDPQPFHLDAEAGRDSLFGGLVASGWFTAGVTMRLQVESGPPVAGGMIGAGGRIEWPRPTRAGDTLRVETEVLEARPSRSRPDRGLVRILATTLNQRDEPVQTFEVTLVVPRRPA
ncbi:MaoC family dehydratase [Miltoncostaea marina]|uniref:MaoC family dehydratase n=1 Tax=Miltoncostaea marina TaxID=2843215 RepID=UPI001C3D53A8|nr:MaoC family dehydratase [Miltoncostaea marina]